MGFSCVCRHRLKMEEPSRVPEAPSTVAQGNKHRTSAYCGTPFLRIEHPELSRAKCQISRQAGEGGGWWNWTGDQGRACFPA